MEKVQEKSLILHTAPTRRLSPWRVLCALVLIIGTTSYIGHMQWKKFQQRAAATATMPPYNPWFAAYTDATSTPLFAFEKLGSTTTPHVILSFIVSSSSDACTPSWGTHYSMDEAAIALDLDRRIVRLEQQGGSVAVSFGGALNSELSLQCTDADKLYAAYKSVIDRYRINTIDLDLENTSLTDQAAADRRATVIARLQHDCRSEGKDLAVWLTLPVSPQGLTQEGTDAVAKMLSNGVDLAGVNIMTMDYGQSRDQHQSMLDASKRAAIETHRQLGILYQQAGITLNPTSLWRKIGVTPMIGQNDTIDDVFTVDDARGVNEFALNQGIERISMWSANRDIPCGENYVDVKVVSDACSGVKTPEYGFAQALSTGITGSFAQSANLLTIADPESNTHPIDDPEKSPYQIWKETGAYPKGVKVVWHGNVYEAKWWTKNDLPDNPVLQAWQTPWQLLGPVLPGDKPIKQPTLPKGTYPAWSGKTIYNGGDRVLFDGTPFQAKWWNQGESPAASMANPDNSPWLALTQDEINAILGGQ